MQNKSLTICNPIGARQKVFSSENKNDIAFPSIEKATAAQLKTLGTATCKKAQTHSSRNETRTLAQKRFWQTLSRQHNSIHLKTAYDPVVRLQSSKSMISSATKRKRFATALLDAIRTRDRSSKDGAHEGQFRHAADEISWPHWYERDDARRIRFKIASTSNEFYFSPRLSTERLRIADSSSQWRRHVFSQVAAPYRSLLQKKKKRKQSLA